MHTYHSRHGFCSIRALCFYELWQIVNNDSAVKITASVNFVIMCYLPKFLILTE